jgi:hypothetical protein
MFVTLLGVLAFDLLCFVYDDLISAFDDDFCIMNDEVGLGFFAFVV